MKLHHGQKSTVVGHRGRQNAGGFLCFKPTGVEIDKEMKIDSSRGEKRSRRKGFARAFKAVLFRPKSRMRIAEDRAGEEGSCSFRIRKSNHNLESGIGMTSSMLSTSSSCSSSSSCLSSYPSESPTTSIASSSKSNPINKKHSRGEERGECFNQQTHGWSPTAIGAVLVVISLSLTIFWGRLWAIGLNAVWLCSIPKQGSRRRLTTGTTPFEDRMNIMECSSVDKKRRVIMEGLLDRRRHHRHRNCQQLTMP